MRLTIESRGWQVGKMAECFLDEALVRSNVCPMPVNLDAVQHLAHVAPRLITWVNAANRVVRKTGDDLDLVPKSQPLLRHVEDARGWRADLWREVVGEHGDIHASASATGPRPQ